jgi:hypothetical protein
MSIAGWKEDAPADYDAGVAWRATIRTDAEARFGDVARLTMFEDPIPLPFDERLVEPQPSRAKPVGLWYACGLEWIEYALYNAPDWIYNNVYAVEVNLDAMLRVPQDMSIKDFTTEYRTYSGPRDGTNAIDWARVAEDYAGIEICPYQGEHRSSRANEWYYTWDVASGCVWGNAAVINIEKIA